MMEFSRLDEADSNTIMCYFLALLKQHGALSLYFDNAKGFSLYWRIKSPAELIDLAFHWGSTPQGHSFWSKLNACWIHMLSSPTTTTTLSPESCVYDHLKYIPIEHRTVATVAKFTRAFVKGKHFGI